VRLIPFPEQREFMPMSKLKASVLLCTYNPRERYLRRVLEGLQSQSLPLDQWELIVVDNASTIPVANNFDLTWQRNGRITREEKLGKMHAWFNAINEAKGEILIFVDDDNVLDSNYLAEAIAIAEEKPIIGAWGGSVRPEFESTLPEWMNEQKWRLSIEEVREDVWSNLREGFETKPMGAGMCVRWEVAARYLEWCCNNEMSYALDRKGDLITGYGEMNLALCAIDLGLGTGKFARLRLTHLIPSSRLTLDYLVRQSEGDAASFMIFRALWGLPIKPPPNAFFLRMQWHFWQFLSRMSPESVKIHEAYLRGAKAGWHLIQEHKKELGNLREIS